MNEAEGSKNSLQHRIKKEKNVTDGQDWDGKTPCEETEKVKQPTEERSLCVALEDCSENMTKTQKGSCLYMYTKWQHVSAA